MFRTCLFFLNMDNKRSARQAAPDNYYDVPAKQLKANGSAVSRNPKRKSNGFGSQSDATKTELIEVQQKLEEKELRITIIERELVEKTNETISLKTQVEYLRNKLEEMEDKTEDKMEAYSNNKNKDLIEVRIRSYIYKS